MLFQHLKLMLLSATLLLLTCCLSNGCSHDLYEPLPYQSMRLVGDARATVTFPVKMPDGTVQLVVTGTTLRDGSLVKQLSSDQAAAYQAGLAKDLAATKP